MTREDNVKWFVEKIDALINSLWGNATSGDFQSLAYIITLFEFKAYIVGLFDTATKLEIPGFEEKGADDDDDEAGE